VRLFGPAPLPLDRRLPVDAALDDAFAPLRARTANVGPARVRAALRWAAPDTRRLGGLALLARVSELTVAAAISAFIFAGAVTPAGAVPATTDASRDAVTAGEWTLNGWNAYQPPDAGRVTDYRIVVGGIAANAVVVRRRDAELNADRDPYPGLDAGRR